MLNVSSIPNDPNKVYVAIMATRFGAHVFTTKVEYRHFHPSDQKLNDLIQIYTPHFFHQPFMVMELPRDFKKEAKRIAQETGMKMVKGVPTKLLYGKPDPDHIFPINGDNVYNLENRERPPIHRAPYLTEDDEIHEIHRVEAERRGLPYTPVQHEEPSRPTQTSDSNPLDLLSFLQEILRQRQQGSTSTTTTSSSSSADNRDNEKNEE